MNVQNLYFTVKELGKGAADVGKAMGEGGAAMGKGAGQMGSAAALIELHGVEHTSTSRTAVSLLDIASEATSTTMSSSTITSTTRSTTMTMTQGMTQGMTTMMGDPGAALEQFAKAEVDARHAQMEWGNALVDKADFQVATAKKSDDKCAKAAALANLAKAKEKQYQAGQDMGRAKNNQASAAEKAAAFAKGVPMEGDRFFKLDVPLGSNEEKFTCIKFDLFGCGCKSLPR